MKKYFVSLIALLMSAALQAEDTTFAAGNLTVVWSEANRAFSVRGTLPDGTSKSIVTRSKPKASATTAGGTDLGYFTTDRYSSVDYRTEPVTDEFGEGTAHIFTFSQPTETAAAGVVMQQTFYTYAGLPFVLTRLSLISTEGPISSHHLEPVCCEAATWRFLSTSEADNRMLKVPFDNDGFGRYHTYRLNRSMTSYEVACLFDGAARYGAVYGSVDHDQWKSGIYVDATSGTSIKKLQLICGMADGETRDDLSDYGHQDHRRHPSECPLPHRPLHRLARGHGTVCRRLRHHPSRTPRLAARHSLRLAELGRVRRQELLRGQHRDL